MKITALPTALVQHWREGGPDAHGQAPETAVSDGSGVPCRHCLSMVAEGRPYLILAHRPFDALQPYAECGPIFVCAENCARFDSTETALPPAFTASPDYLIKGYSAQDRIVYGTGMIAPQQALPAHAADILADPGVAYVHVRSARNNCYLARIDRH